MDSGRKPRILRKVLSILPILLALAVVGHLVRERWMIMSASVSLVRLEFEVFGKVQGEQSQV